MTEQFDSPADLDDAQEGALEALLLRLADDEFVLAERYTEWQVRAPTLESDLALSNNAQDELGHARLWYDVLEDLGHEEHELIYEREPDRWHHSTLAEQPFEKGNWADAIVRHYLYDVAEQLRLEALEESTYTRVAGRVGKIQNEEEFHREHAESWMERLADGGTGTQKLQDAVDRLFPHALTLFEPVDEDLEATIVAAGFRDGSLTDLREDWLSIVVPYLDDLGLETPASEIIQYDDWEFEVTEDVLADAVGRDGDHTDAWPELHDDFTHTYRELGRNKATQIMEKPE